MSGINFIDTIVVRSTGKGTHTIKESLKSMNWAGESFKKSQEGKLGKISGLKIQSAKGTSKIELGKMYKTSIPKVDGMYISVNRGTGLLKL
ncbi:MAG: hypothetical protein K5790_04095 [Nitrosopumilus sp.]|uniref:hypothetical protein n=1 Tax=Nitrosopumilus sp. TaxID=2024843 RepID=UPI00247D25DE|nr:hypothetical protein [Nitrosopumilus sp.]MCV0392459.1 hypothetical protein [Nitrosopumilus sp.]